MISSHGDCPMLVILRVIGQCIAYNFKGIHSIPNNENHPAPEGKVRMAFGFGKKNRSTLLHPASVMNYVIIAYIYSATIPADLPT